MPDENRVADDNVSFTDVGDPTGGGARQGSSGMLDLLGSLEKKKEAKKNKKKKATKKKKKEKTKYKKVRKVDKYESQNFLYRVEGSMFCAGIIVGLIMILTFIILGIVFSVRTNGNMVSYMSPWWGTADEAKDDSGED
ncbi:hypothetical protein GCK72_005507 [Caenorhabditis remanei]|uniref:Uncharacterized protein n=1 Tax=Caenorhabditis remanei TaxID=31234 RepID=E3LFQ0_CAERE|nr:hypothetical protein GCK72_005507 [Caenorhabditis remanei]EFO85723.1 hypothetical protein CRE_02218 [Caenorhabditis remanei]KAF1765555.1 hypothetical protein GCK72_005507 [Caenorhabditis remanei]